MISYEYECSNCGHGFEIEQSIKDSPKKKCPECKKHSLERIIGTPHVIMNNVNTIGQLADRNAKKYRSQIEEKQAKKAQNSPKKDDGVFSSFGSATKKEINRMTAKQKRKYIMEGKK